MQVAKISAFIASAIAAAALYSGNGRACCMVPATYRGSIGQDAQEAVLIHDAGREELVLRINYRITGESMPDTFAWVVTTPSEPDDYAVADAALFEEMYTLALELLAPGNSRSMGKSAGVGIPLTAGVELGKRVQVGPYDIQPVRGVGPEALQGLNRWLDDNGFPTEEPNHMTYFVNNNFTFLCIRIIPAKGEQSVGSNGILPPLHLSFESRTPYYPLRFSSRQGVFDVNLHVLTRDKLDYGKSEATLEKINWTDRKYERNARLKEQQMPETLKSIFRNSRFRNDIGKWRYNNLFCSRVNRGNTISTWTEDVFLAVR